MVHDERRRARGSTLIEIVVAIAILALIVTMALPSYLGTRGRGPADADVARSRSNKAAIDEANAMAQQWRSLAYACYLQAQNASACASNASIGFGERPGVYWNWTSAAATYAVSGAAGSTEITVSWPSSNAGLEQGETYVVTLFLDGVRQGQAVTTCIPGAC